MSEPTSDALLIAEGLLKTYDQGRVHALDDVDLTLARGELVSVMGKSGSGKSTLLHMLGALDRPDAGRVVLDGEDLAKVRRLDRVRARKIGFIFQLHNLLPRLTAQENVELPLRALGTARRERRRRARELLEAVGLEDRTDHAPPKLSGGQRQRVAIARALANDPELILADEPTGDLDEETGARIVALLHHLHETRGLTLLLVTHDKDLALEAERTIRLQDGRVVESWQNERERQNGDRPRSAGEGTG